MDEVQRPEQKEELELELTVRFPSLPSLLLPCSRGDIFPLALPSLYQERDTLIATLRQEVVALKARLGESEEDPSSSASPLPPPSSSPSPDQTEVLQLLRTSLSETAADRDDLLQSLAITRSEQATLQARLSDLEEENEMLLLSRLNSSKAVEEEKEKRIAGEETIAMLRSTVEEARKGLMRLQTEKNFKRTSSNPTGLGFDMGGTAGSGGLGVDGLPQSGGGSNPPSSFFSTSTPPPTASTITSKRDKRASLNVGYGVVPAGRAGNSHRRVSSISDSAIPFNPSSDPSSSSLTPAPTNKAGLRELRLAGPPPPVSGGIGSFLGFGGGAAASTTLDGRRVSQLSVPASPSKAPIDLTSDLSDGGSDAGAIEASRLAAMRKLEGIPASPVIDPAELVALRAQMGALQSELVEAREAREASESACRALREFIAFSSRTNEAAAAGGELEGGAFGSGAGVEGGMSLPPLPSDMEDAEEEQARRVSASPPPPPPTAARTWSMGGLFKKDPKVPTPDPSLVTPTASPNPLVSPQSQDQDSPAGSTAFVSSWSRSVSQAGPISPPSLTTVNPIAASPPRPPPKSKFSFFSSKSLTTPTPPAEDISPLSSPLPPPPPPPHDDDKAEDDDEPPLVSSKSNPDSDPTTSSSPPRVASPTPPTPTSPAIPEVITTLPPTSSQLSSPPPPSIPEGSEETEPSSEDTSNEEVASEVETLAVDEEVSLKD